MTARGVARLVGRTLAEFARGVALCCRELAADVADDLHRLADDLASLVHLSDAIRDAFTDNVDDRLAGYEAHAWPYEDVTARDNVGWQ